MTSSTQEQALYFLPPPFVNRWLSYFLHKGHLSFGPPLYTNSTLVYEKPEYQDWTQTRNLVASLLFP